MKHPSGHHKCLMIMFKWGLISIFRSGKKIKKKRKEEERLISILTKVFSFFIFFFHFHLSLRIFHKILKKGCQNFQNIPYVF
jgi:hypothetical protein